MDQVLSSWGSMTGAYFAAPLALLGGRFQLLDIIPTLGMVLLVVGLVLGFVRREKQMLWLLPPLLLAALAPIVISYSSGVLGWLGMAFALAFGGIGLLVWIGIVAGDATHRAPVWLVGLSFVSFVVYCALIAVALTWGVV